MRRALPFVALLLAATAAKAEPYLAARTGLGCASCHWNRTGGGLRTAYGAGYGAQTLPWTKLAPGHGLFDGAVGDRVRLGLDGRGGYTATFRDDGPYIGEAELSEAEVYLGVDLLKDRLSAYVDAHVAPGGATAREAFAIYAFSKGGMYLKGGKFFLPFGLRFQDDDAANRRGTGFTFESSDIGAEFGFDNGLFTSALSVSNGTSGGAEQDNDKQYTWTGAALMKKGRLGLSASNNDLPDGAHRTVFGAFGTLHFGRFVILAEVDALHDADGLAPARDGQAGHLELDVALHDGMTLRGFAGGYDPAMDDGQRGLTQWGVGLDWTPLPGLQIRGGYRNSAGPAGVPGANDDRAFLEAHVYF